MRSRDRLPADSVGGGFPRARCGVRVASPTSVRRAGVRNDPRRDHNPLPLPSPGRSRTGGARARAPQALPQASPRQLCGATAPNLRTPPAPSDPAGTPSPCSKSCASRTSSSSNGPSCGSAAGLNVLTGETGAGKTVLAHALDLLLGGKPRSGIVRPGAQEAYVEGVFALPDELRETLGDRLPDDAEDVVLARRVSAEGRTRAYLGGRSATAADLRDVGGALLSFYGQHEHRKLTLASAQLEILDGFCGDGQAARRAAFAAAYAHERELRGRAGGAEGPRRRARPRAGPARVGAAGDRGRRPERGRGGVAGRRARAPAPPRGAAGRRRRRRWRRSRARAGRAPRPRSPGRHARWRASAASTRSWTRWPTG